MLFLFPNLFTHTLVTRPILFCTLYLAVHHAVTANVCLYFLSCKIILPISLALFQLVHCVCFKFLCLHTVIMRVGFTEETPNNTPFRINLTIIPINANFLINNFLSASRITKYYFTRIPKSKTFSTLYEAVI